MGEEELRAEVARLRLALEGEEKARALLMKGMESQCGLMDGLKQRTRFLEAEAADLREKLRLAYDRIAAQSDLLTRRAEKDVGCG